MNRKQFREMVQFRNQMAFCSIFCWLVTIYFSIMVPKALDELILIPIGGVILTIITFRLNKQIAEERKNNE